MAYLSRGLYVMTGYRTVGCCVGGKKRILRERFIDGLEYYDD